MDMYHSRLTQDDLNDLIIKYKIPHDLHPRLTFEEFVTFELLDNAIGIYHQMFDFSGVRIPFSSFLMAIPDFMVWRHPSATIDNPRPAVGAFSMADIRHLSAHMIKLRDMPEGVLVLSGLSRVWKSHTGAEVQEEPHHDIRPTLQRLSFYCTPPAAVDDVIPDPTLEDLVMGTPSAKILAKAEASQKRKASTFGATSIHVAKRTRGLILFFLSEIFPSRILSKKETPPKSGLTQSSGSTTRPGSFMDNSDNESADDDDACVEISLVTPIRSAAVIPSSGTRAGALLLPLLKVLAPEILGARALWPMILLHRLLVRADRGHPPFTREEWDAPYWPTFGVLTKEVFKDPVVCKTMVDQFPTPGEMIRVETLSDDQLTAKMSVLHYMMMLHGGELLARYRGLLQSHHEYVLAADSRLKGYEERVAGLTRLELQVSALKRQVSGFNDKLSSSDAYFAKSKAEGKESDEVKSPPEHPKEKCSLDTPAKLTRAKLNKRSGDADLSKDKSGPKSPLERRRSWYVKGHIRFGVISSVLAQRYLRTIRQRRRRNKIRRNQADPDIHQG
ncbi:hypothetical protein Tco_0647969 [Tanacetum coccineum]